MKKVVAKDLNAGDEVWDFNNRHSKFSTKLRFVKIDKCGDALFEMVSGLMLYHAEKLTQLVGFPSTEIFYVQDDILPQNS